MRLYVDPISPASRPVTFLLHDHSIPFVDTLVNLHLSELLTASVVEAHPMADVPLLDDDGHLLSEGTAILKYVALKHELPLYPSELRAQSRVDEVLAWSCRLSMHGSPRELERLDRTLARHCFAAGSELSIADYVATSYVTLAEYTAFDFSPYPNVVAWLERMKARPGYRKAFAGFLGLVTAARRERREAASAHGRASALPSFPTPTTKGIHTMIKVIVRQKVENFEHWYRAYKSFAALRARYHVLADEVFRVLDSPNEVIVTHDFAEPGHITAMVESAELHAALAQAGVVGEGTVWMGAPTE
ncbi:MAG TPA: glutathione S-transferase family protein [Polyangiaceae bacterium]|jgi:glutathione S-transferase|nr:glutathione S-transferase family protein [Polyangiaceae bacterium]